MPRKLKLAPRTKAALELRVHQGVIHHGHGNWGLTRDAELAVEALQDFGIETTQHADGTVTFNGP